MVIQLMRYGADPSISDGEGYRGLHLAILFQHMAVAAYLMAKGQVSFLVVLQRCWNELILILLCSVVLILDQEVDGPDCNGQTPLMLAAQKIIGSVPHREASNIKKCWI